MKKVVIIAAVALLGMASCKKTFTCDCVGVSSTSVYEKTVKGKDAESACTDSQNKTLGIPTEICVPK
jgi:hypothetical protein